MGDYCDILSLTRVLMYGPKSKAKIDVIIERCAGAGHIREDILEYIKELENVPGDDDEHRAYITDMGIKALRRYFFLITFRSYLYCTSSAETNLSAWVDARPELGDCMHDLISFVGAFGTTPLRLLRNKSGSWSKVNKCWLRGVFSSACTMREWKNLDILFVFPPRLLMPITLSILRT